MSANDPKRTFRVADVDGSERRPGRERRRRAANYVARHVGLRRTVNRESPARELTDTAVVEAIHAALPD